MNLDPKVNKYIEDIIDSQRNKIIELRKMLLNIDSNIVEVFSYQIPTYKYLGKSIIHYGVMKTHISIFPGPEAIITFSDELKMFKTAKGTIHIGFHDDFPFELIKKLAKYNMSKIKK